VPSASAKLSPRTFSSFPLHVRFLSSSLHPRFAHGRRAHRSAAAAPAWPTASGRRATLSSVTSIIDLFALEEESSPDPPRAAGFVNNLAAGPAKTRRKIRHHRAPSGFLESVSATRVSRRAFSLLLLLESVPESGFRRGQSTAAAPRRRRRRFSPPRVPLVSRLDADEHCAPSRALLCSSRAWNRTPAKFRRGAAVWKATGD
jgi:hypothetical protein